MKILIKLVCILICFSCTQKLANHEKFFVKNTVVNGKSFYFVVDYKNDTVLKLDPAKYFVCFDDTIEHYLVVASRKRGGWWAIDLKENFLFQVYNTSPGEPSPDKISYDRIRIIDDDGKIGFADGKGNIVIKPQFEQVTAFYKDYAIIGEKCKKIPWDTIHKDLECDHYSIVCSKNGYIDKSGNIIEIVDLTFEQLKEKLNFPKKF